MAIRQRVPGPDAQGKIRSSRPIINARSVEGSSRAGPLARNIPALSGPMSNLNPSPLSPREAAALLERLDRACIVSAPDYTAYMEALVKLRSIAGDYAPRRCSYCKWTTGHASNCPYDNLLEIE